MSNTNLSILQWNLNKAFLASTELSLKFQNKSHNIALLTEPYVCYGKVVNIPQGCRVHADSDSPRAAIIYDKLLNFTGLPQFTSKDCSAGILKAKDRDILLVSYYFDINKPIMQEGVTTLLQFAASKNFEINIKEFETRGGSNINTLYR